MGKTARRSAISGNAQLIHQSGRDGGSDRRGRRSNRIGRPPSGTKVRLALEGLSWARWLFALRIWAAVILALGVAFWLELDGASSAGVCVAILALQTRGQVLEKAFYRMLGTIIGAVASMS
jgi:Fusaric acid resistance protein family